MGLPVLVECCDDIIMSPQGVWAYQYWWSVVMILPCPPQGVWAYQYWWSVVMI